jgi:hypothetical protein
LKVKRKGEEKGFNAEDTEDAEFAEKRKAAEGSLDYAARRARKRRGRKSRAASLGMTGLSKGQRRGTVTLSSQRKDKRGARRERRRKDPSTTRPDAPEGGAEERIGSRPAGSG